MTTENTDNEQFTPAELAYLQKMGYKAPEQPAASLTGQIKSITQDQASELAGLYRNGLDEAFTQAEQAYLDNLKNKNNGNK